MAGEIEDKESRRHNDQHLGDLDLHRMSTRSVCYPRTVAVQTLTLRVVLNKK